MQSLARTVITFKVWHPLGAVTVLAAATMVVGIRPAAPAGATTSVKVTGGVSTYAALAFQTWTVTVDRHGLNVTTTTATFGGLNLYRTTEVDFAGSEGEFSEIYADTPNPLPPDEHVARGFAYAPDLGSGSAIMYHVARNATGSSPVTDLRLSRLTVAEIFLGVITNWDSPTISADNTGLVLPNEPINVDYRSGQSGLTALFYDFVKHEDPTTFTSWAEHCGYNPTYRVWQITDCLGGTGFARTSSWSGGDQQAQFIASSGGMWSIGYDEFSYAKDYDDHMASIENESGDWVQPSAASITAALQTAKLNQDTSETLSGVYTSLNPASYPISFYDYIVYQCAVNPEMPTCQGTYANPAVASTLAKFMLYIACTGQRNLAQIGYAPLPADLSQQLANAIGYMTGEPPEHLTAANCASPEFAPIITTFSPASGTDVGGTTVTITGAGFTGATAVKFGTSTAASFTVKSPTTIKATTPIHAPGTAAISVTTPAGTVNSSSDFTFAFTQPPQTTSSSGYDLVGSDGGVFVFPTGNPGGFYGSLPGLGVSVNDIVGMVPTSNDQGYFLVGSDGGVFAFGNAPFLGSLPGLGIKPAQSITGIVPTGTDGGYFLVGKDGGVYAFGNAPFLGSLPGDGVHADNIVGIAATPSGNGYWVVSGTGTVYAFGAAKQLGSAMGTTSPVSAIAGTPTGGGYWLVTQIGSVDAFGNAGYHGSLPGLGVIPAKPVIGVVHTAGTGGYWLIGSDGGIFAFGDAGFVGSLPALGVSVTDIVGAVPTG